MDHTSQDRPANSADVRRVFGDVEDHVIAEVLAGEPSIGDLTRAALWTRGDGDQRARDLQDLNAREAAVAAVLIRLKEEEMEGDAR